MRLFATLAIAVVVPVAAAQHQTFTVNADASQVKMTLKTNHETVNGSFHVQSGAVEFDRSAAKMAGSVVVAAGSGATGNSLRDKRMNKEILVVDKYATVTFEPKSYTGTIAVPGDSSIQVTGIITLLGKPHEITIPMQVHTDGSAAKAEAHFVVPYVQWGLKNPSLMIWKAEDTVAIDLELAGAFTK